MQPPAAQTFGLSPDELGEVAAKREWILGRIINIGAFAGAGVGVVIGLSSGELGPVLGLGWLGFLAGSGIAALIRSRLVEWIDRRIPRYLKYEEARNAFEAWQARTRAEYWLTLTGHAFERELATVFERAGFEVTRTPGSGDGGIDIVLRRAGKTTIVQCKHTKNPVGPGVARDLYGALTHCGADDGILAVTGGVTSGVHDFFRGKQLRVMDLQEIISLHEATRR